MVVRTIRCRLCVDEATRKFFWKAMVDYTLLVNHLFAEIAKSSKFKVWQAAGEIPRKPIEELIAEFTTSESEQLPYRFRSSAVLMSQYVYKAWFKQQKNRRLRLQGKQRWVDAIERDSELTQITSFNRQEICSKAQDILNLASRQGIGSLSTRSHRIPKSGSTLLGFLLDRLDTTNNLLEQRAVIHLLKNDLTVSEQDKDPDVLLQRLESKKIEIEQLAKQLQSQLPKGRDPTGARYAESLLAAIALPSDGEENWANVSLSALKEQKQVELFNSLPYPLILGSADNLIWSVEARNSALENPTSGAEPEPAKIKKHKRKRRKPVSDHLCVRFKGLGDSWFKIQCDRRQLPIFRQFLTDYQLHFQPSEEERFSQALFVLKSAQLLWRPDTQKHCHQSVSTEQSQICTDQPWKTHRLYLHCNIDTRLLTADGTEEVKEQIKKKTLKILKGKETLNEEQLQKLDLRDEQRSHVKRLKSTLARLDNPAPPRPSVIRYQGNPLITVGVSFNPQTPLTACVVDLQTGNVLDCQNAKQLLAVKTIKVKRGTRSTLQLKLADWRLVNKLHFQRQRNLLKRPKEYEQGQYRETKSESSLGLHLERLLAFRLVRLAIRWQAGSIAVPNLKHIREILESDIQARARRKYHNQKELQGKYAKQFRTTIHRWSYSRLAQCIRNRAEREGIVVITGQQSLQGDPQQEAEQVALSAHAS